jgi:uncharacterized protein involved in type VI secretion and phage assembly
MNERYVGKFRGSVVNNVDPEGRGRILAMVPGVPGLEKAPTSWALPCIPLAGKQRGMYVVPEPGAGVWIEFEQGDPRQPVWVGGFWGTGSEVPSDAKLGVPATPSVVLQTSSKTVLVMSETAGPTGGIELRCGATRISVNDSGITIENGKGASLQLSGSSVDINNGALKVT